MITTDQAYAAFRDANPAPVVEVDSLPSPLEALQIAQGTPTRPAPPEAPRRSLRAGLVTVVAVFALVVALGVLAFFAGRSPSDDVVNDPQVTTTVAPPTTTVAPTTAPPTTTAPPPTTPVITPETQALLDQFAAAYGRDFDSFATLLDPELEMHIRIELDPVVPWDLEEIREQFDFYELLNTSLELGSCRALDAEATSCLLLRTDDLTRIHELEPATDVRIVLRFTDGLVTTWTELPAKEDDYQRLAVAPFARWLDATHPEVPNPKVWGGAPWWTPRDNILELFPGLVAEYAASLGVSLDG